MTRAGISNSLEATTARRRRIVAALGHGLEHGQIARELGVSLRTVQRHRAAHWAGLPPKRPGPPPR